jgi:CSLREA domain-containing protein
MSRPSPRTPVRLRSFLPRLEVLELRDVPAAIVVDSTGDTVANDGVTTLREAIIQANNQAGDDTITFAAGLTSGGAATITLNSALPDLNTNVQINGPGANLLTVQRNTAKSAFGVFTANSAATVGITGLTIDSGNAVSGGGVLDDGATLTLTQCEISNNVATDSGGGLAVINAGIATVDRCTFDGNLADSNGGAIENNGGNLTVINSTLSGDTADGNGGGIDHEGGGGEITSVTHATITNNRADGDANGSGIGGGIYLADSGMTLKNSIVAGNFDGAGTTTAGDIQGPALLDTFNSQYDLIGTGGAGGLFGFGSNQINVANPGLFPLDYYGGPTKTHALTGSSPALDAGNNFSGLAATDQRGFARTVVIHGGGFGDSTDIGAFEHRGAATITVNSLNDDTSADGSLTLREALTYRLGSLGRLLTAAEKALISGDVGVKDTIPLNISGTVSLTSALPDLSNGVTLIGRGANKLTVQRSAAGGIPNFRIFNAPAGSTVAISGMTITNGNSTADGGGIENAGALSLSGVALVGNAAPSGFGGGLENAGGAVTIVNSTVSGNTATGSGGLDTFNSGTLTLFGVTVSGNTSTGNAGGIGSDSSITTLVDSTIANNHAASVDGGMLAAGGTVTLRNTIVAGNTIGAGNTPDNIQGTVDAAHSHFNIIGSAGFGGLVNGQNGNKVGVADAGLLPLANNGGPLQTIALKPTSVARDAGTSFLTAVADQLDAVTTTFNVLDATFLAQGAAIRVDDEEMLITGINGNTITVTRCVNGTTATFHLQGAGIRAARDERGLTRTKDFAGIANALGGDATDIGAFEAQATVLGVGMGGGPSVKLVEADTQKVVLTVTPFGGVETSGMQIATGDLTGDGVPDLVASNHGIVRVFDGTNGTLVQELHPFGATYTGGISLAVADLNGDGFGEMVVGTGANVQADVRVYSSKDWSNTWEFQPFARFYGGLSVAADAGRIIVGTANVTSQVAVFDYGTKTKAGVFTAYVFGSAGVNVAAGDVNGDGVSDIIVSAARGTDRRVLLYRADTRTAEGQIMWTGLVGSGLRVAVGDLDGDGKLDVVVASGKYTQPTIRGYSGTSFLELAGWQPFANNFLGGVLVG